MHVLGAGMGASPEPVPPNVRLCKLVMHHGTKIAKIRVPPIAPNPNSSRLYGIARGRAVLPAAQDCVNIVGASLWITS
eukprot:352652-Chlamydomonas_euryale.AAC.5